MESNVSAKKENRLMAATLAVFFVSGASSVLMGMVAEHAGIQMGMGVVVAVTVLLLITILFSVFAKGTEEE